MRKSIIGTLGVAFVWALHASAFAQVQVVTVTAQKRAEDVQDVPISITAYSGSFLEDKSIDNLQELNTFTPNFRVDTGNNPRNSTIRIRGVGSNAQNAGIEASVGTFVDGVYVPRIGALLGDLADIETIEVLRGPQGTLYGRNTSVGALNITTRRPSQEFEAQAKVGFGNFDKRNFSGYVNGGITDSFSARFSFWSSDFAGYEKNIVSGTHAGGRENYGGRVRALWEANDSTDIQLILDYNKQVSYCCVSDWLFTDLTFINSLNEVATGTGIPLATQLAAHSSARDRVVSSGGNQNNEDEQWGAAVIVDTDLGGNLEGHTFRSTTSFRKWDFNGNLSNGQTYVELQTSNQTQLEKTLSQEFNLFSPDGGVDFFGPTKLEYTLGAYFYKQRSTTTQAATFTPASIFLPGVRSSANGSGAPCTGFPGSPTCPFANITRVVGQMDQNVWNQHSRSYAFFGQATLWLMPDVWAVMGGIRYSKDKKALYMDSTYIGGTRGLNPTGNNQSFGSQFNSVDYVAYPEEDAITWLANTRYYFNPDVHLFFTTSTGYKSPGGSARPYRQPQAARSQPTTFGAEKSITFEVGAKTKLFDDRLMLNVGVFRTLVNNFQQNITDPNVGPGAFTVNFGKLRQQGVEFDGLASPTDWLDIDMSAAYLDSEWVDFPNGPCGDAGFITTVPVPGTTVCNYNGRPQSYSPKWTSHLGATVTFPLLNTALIWFTGGDWNYNGNMFLDSDGDIRTREPSHHTFNAKLGIKGNDGRWQIMAWVKNITDELIYRDRAGGAGGQFLGQGNSRRVAYDPPRTFGLEGKVDF